MKKVKPARMLFAALGISVLTALTACSGGSGSGDGTIVLGYSGPLSGGAAAYGENIQAGIELAVADLNKAGVTVDGKKYEVKLESLDDQYSPNTAATNAQRLVEQNKANVVFIPHAGGIKSAQALNTGRTEFLLAAYSSDPAILTSGNELTMMIPPSFASYAKPYVKTMMDNGGTTLGLLGTASEYGQQWTKIVSKEWKDQGGKVLPDHAVDYGTVSDFAGPVSQTLAEKPDVIFVGGPSQPTALIIEEARKQGFKGQFLIMDQAKFSEMEKIIDPKDLNGSIATKPAIKYEDPGTKSLIEAYDEKVKKARPMTTEVSLNYQGVAVVVKAMEVAGKIDDPKAIRDAIPEAIGQVDDQFHVTGFPTRITDSGHLINDNLDVLYRTKDGKEKSVLIEQVDD